MRLSGPNAYTIASKIFHGQLADRHLCYGHIVNPESNERVDEALVSYMLGPRTYTKEDVVEINCHGGTLPLQGVLGLVLRHGARLAQPGEFTLRAFLNGRIDLTQAEAVLDIIRAKTRESLSLAISGLDGHFSGSIKAIRSNLMDVLAYLTARIDFPEDEVEEQDIQISIKQALKEVEQLISTAGAGIIYRQGVRTAIVGRPNVGKSSVLNRLLREDRAIVTPIPGTTRDTVEEIANLGGIPFVMIDTAGILNSNDPVESLGVERSHKAIEQADMIFWVIDISEQMTATNSELFSLLAEKKVLAVANKCDLPQQANIESLTWETVCVSALTGDGFSELENKAVNMVLEGRVVTNDSQLVTNPRHKDALERAQQSLSQALYAIESDMPDDFITIDLTAALNALGEITGEVVKDDLLETIFSNFCIGK